MCFYDIIILTESWLNDNFSTSEVNFINYYVYRSDRNSEVSSKSRGGGVIVLVHKSLQSQLVPVASPSKSYELLFVKVQLQGEALLFACSYIPPSSPLDVYVEHCNVVEHVCVTVPHSRAFLLGDYNLNTASWSSDEECSLIVSCPLSSPAIHVSETYNSLSLHQVNTLPNDHNVYLDLLFSNDSSISTERAHDLLLPNNFHHVAFFFNVVVKPHVEFLTSNLNVLDYKKCKIDDLKLYLKKADWNSVFGHTDLEVVVDSFYNVLLTGIELTTPRKRIFSSSFPRWFSNTLRKLTFEKKKAHLAYKKSGSESDYSRFSNLRSRCKILSSDLHKLHLEEVSDSIKSNPRFFWKYSEETRKIKGLPRNMFLDETISSTPQETANLLAECFSSVYQEPKNRIPPYGLHDVIDFNCCQFNVLEVFKALSRLPPKFSSGPDNIPSFILKSCASLLSTPLCKIFNISLSKGVFPTMWKSSFVVPIFKSGDRCNVRNYRGVCIQSAIPKLLDKLVTERLASVCKHFIADEQHGFVAKRSTVTNLLLYQQDIVQSFQDGTPVHSVYTDVAKAFDRVDVGFLVAKLRSYGIGDFFLNWLSSSFSGRTQSVRVNESFSEPIQVSSGVGQGSHMGPLLFSLFFNDLPDVIKHSSVLLFADDVKLYKSISMLYDCNLLQSDINSFNHWLSLNGMSLSLNKCFLVEFSRSRVIDFTYTIAGTPIVKVEEIRDLGITLDRKLTFVPHITHLSMRCHRILGYVCRNSRGLSFEAFMLLYKALVRSILEYAGPVWSPYYESHIHLLERVQKKFLWYVRFRYPNNAFELPTLKDRRSTADMVFLSKLLAGGVDCSRLLGLVGLDGHRRLRNEKTFFVTNCNTNYSFYLPLNRMTRNANANPEFDF